MTKKLVGKKAPNFKAECTSEKTYARDDFNGKNLVLQLDHINGINDDYRIENLRILCPNCHSQTATFTSKRLKKEKRIYTCDKCGGIKKQKTSNVCQKCHQQNQKLKFDIDEHTLQELIKNKILKKMNY